MSQEQPTSFWGNPEGFRAYIRSMSAEEKRKLLDAGRNFMKVAEIFRNAGLVQPEMEALLQVLIEEGESETS